MRPCIRNQTGSQRCFCVTVTLAEWTEKQPFTETSGWNDQQHPIAHRWDGYRLTQHAESPWALRGREPQQRQTRRGESGGLIFRTFVTAVPDGDGEAGVALPCSSFSRSQGFRWRFKMMGWRRSTVTSGCPVQAGGGQDIQNSPTVSPFLSGTLELSIIQKEDIPFVQATA